MTTGGWAAKRAGRSDARARLASLPESGTGHGSAVPFPFADRKAYEDRHSTDEINAAIKAAPVERVKLSDLHAIQHSVKPERVEQYIDDPGLKPPADLHPRAGTPVDHPVVVVAGGKSYLHDGHHRCTARWCEGHDDVEARVARLPSRSEGAAT